MDINSFESNDPILAVFSRIHNCFLFIKHSLYQYLLSVAFLRPSGNTGRSTYLFLLQLFKLCYSHRRFCNIGLPRFGRKTFMIYCTRWSSWLWRRTELSREVGKTCISVLMADHFSLLVFFFALLLFSCCKLGCTLVIPQEQ